MNAPFKIKQQAFWWSPSLNDGLYYVRYRDGIRSALMPKSCAKSYARIFGGKVQRDEDAPPTLWMRLRRLLLAIPV